MYFLGRVQPCASPMPGSPTTWGQVRHLRDTRAVAGFRSAPPLRLLAVAPVVLAQLVQPALAVLASALGAGAAGAPGLREAVPVRASTGHALLRRGEFGAPQGHTRGRVSGLRVTPSGSLVLEDANHEGPTTTSTTPDPGIIHDGTADVKFPAVSDTEEIQLEEDSSECLVDTPVVECFEKFGSYGIRRLHTEEWDDIVKLGHQRPDWMSNTNVQRRRLFNLTLPGTHNSGSYDFVGEHAIVGVGLAFGIQCQHLSIDRQLELGIRAFDLRISWSFKDDLLYCSHGILTVPLQDVLGQMEAFLESRTKEVIVIQAKVDRMSHKLDERHWQPILDDDKDPSRVPGQLVHEAFSAMFGRMLATYTNLIRLPVGESLANPRISSLVDSGIRVIYFWEGQQVLCTSRTTCQRTPGWTQPWDGYAFGWPMPLGQRQGSGGAETMEPACLKDSWSHTVSAHPEWLAKKVKVFAADLSQAVLETRPACYPEGEAVPPLHSPTIFYWVDGVVTLNADEQERARQLLGSAKSLFTRGEGFSIKSAAERANYLLLVWFMKLNSRALFTRPNVIAMDFAMPILVHRIIEAMQEKKDCGWAITCKKTGSCWAMSLSDPRSDTDCMSEDQVMAILQTHADTKGMTLFWKLVLSLFACFVLLTVVLCYRFRWGKRKDLPGGSPAVPEASEGTCGGGTSSPVPPPAPPSPPAAPAPPVAPAAPVGAP